MTSPVDDIVLPFQLESSHLRGRAVKMGDSLDTILRQHDYPDAIARLLAESVVVATALASSLKYEGVFTLQAKGDGAVRLLVTDVTSDGGVRAYAQFDRTQKFDAPATTTLMGKGFLAFTCALKDQTERYQGIVALEGGTISEAVQHYFRQSEQIPTGIISAVDRNEQGKWRGGCILLQRMPRDGGINVEISTPEAEDWTRAMVLANTCTSQELTDETLETEDLLYRLFHEEEVRAYPSMNLKHQCRCSQERVETMLKSLPKSEIAELASDGKLTITCEFCNKSYEIDADQAINMGKDAPTNQ